MVACRQLGYDYAVRALPRWQVPSGSGQIWLDNVGCYGNEENLTSCYHRGWGIHNCYHYQDAGVQCSFGKLNSYVCNCKIHFYINAHGTHFFQNHHNLSIKTRRNSSVVLIWYGKILTVPILMMMEFESFCSVKQSKNKFPKTAKRKFVPGWEVFWS